MKIGIYINKFKMQSETQKRKKKKRENYKNESWEKRVAGWVEG